MSDTVALILPVLILLCGAGLILLLSLLKNAIVPPLLALLAMIVIVAAMLAHRSAAPVGQQQLLSLTTGTLGDYAVLAVLGLGLILAGLMWSQPAPEPLGQPLAGQPYRGEFAAMMLLAIAGTVLVARAGDLIVLFLALELVSVPTYVMVALSRRQASAQEAALKYFFLGAMATAVLLYGLALLYGATGSTDMNTIAAKLLQQPRSGLCTLGMLLTVTALAFKIAAVPMHFYVPDVYQGADSPTTAFLGFVPKLAGLVALIKILMLIGMGTNGGVNGDFWAPLLWILCAATMTVGNVLALLQHNVKRILAYSSIAHSGYMLIGITVAASGGPPAVEEAISAVMFYIVIYGFMNLGAFGILSLIRCGDRTAEQLDELAGLARRQPLAAAAMAVFLFSLMGMPGTAGFFAKLYVFAAALSHGYIWLAIIGMLNAAVAAAYYLRLLKAVLISEPPAETLAEPLPAALPVRSAVAISAVMVMLLGLWPRLLMDSAAGIDIAPQPWAAPTAGATDKRAILQEQNNGPVGILDDTAGGGRVGLQVRRPLNPGNRGLGAAVSTWADGYGPRGTVGRRFQRRQGMLLADERGLQSHPREHQG